MFGNNITHNREEVNMFRGEKTKKILEAISVLGKDATPRQIAEYTGINYNTIRVVLKRLKDKTETETTSETETVTETETETRSETKSETEIKASGSVQRSVPSFAQDTVLYPRKEYVYELADVVMVVKDRSNTRHIPAFRGKSSLVTDERWLRRWLNEHSFSLEDVFEKWEQFPKEGTVENLNSTEELFNLAGDRVLLDVNPQFQAKFGGKQIILLKGGEKQKSGIREMYPGELALVLKSNDLKLKDVFTRWRVWR